MFLSAIVKANQCTGFPGRPYGLKNVSSTAELDQLQAFCNSADDEMPVPVKLLQQRKMSLKATVNHHTDVPKIFTRPRAAFTSLSWQRHGHLLVLTVTIK